MWWWIQTKAHSFKEQLVKTGHKRRLKKMIGQSDKSHSAYLDIQLARTLSKRHSVLQRRCQDFIDRIAVNVELSDCRVLCVGCRNGAELDYFQLKGSTDVIGIDLYSSDRRIKVMDMHKMMFPDGAFNLVYSSHSLEHSREPQRVAQEMVRVTANGGIVAVEVPVEYQTYGADLFDFKSLDLLHALFAPYLGTVLWESYFPVSEGYGTAVIRSIFRVNKG